MASSHTGMSGCDSGAPPVPAEMSQRVEEPLGAESHGGAAASREPGRGCPGGAGKKHRPVPVLSLSRPVRPPAPRPPRGQWAGGNNGRAQRPPLPAEPDPAADSAPDPATEPAAPAAAPAPRRSQPPCCPCGALAPGERFDLPH